MQIKSQEQINLLEKEIKGGLRFLPSMRKIIESSNKRECLKHIPKTCKNHNKNWINKSDIATYISIAGTCKVSK